MLISCVLVAVALFLVAIVPVITDQVRSITDQAPEWLDRLQNNEPVQELDDEYDVIDKARDYVTDGDFVSSLFGGALGIGLAVLSALFNAFIVIVLTLYFLSSLAHQGRAYRLAPASRRDRVSALGDRIFAPRRLCVRRVHRRDVRRHLVAGLPFPHRPGRVRRRAGLRGRHCSLIPMIGATISGAVMTSLA